MKREEYNRVWVQETNRTEGNQKTQDHGPPCGRTEERGTDSVTKDELSWRGGLEKTCAESGEVHADRDLPWAGTMRVHGMKPQAATAGTWTPDPRIWINDAFWVYLVGSGFASLLQFAAEGRLLAGWHWQLLLRLQQFEC